MSLRRVLWWCLGTISTTFAICVGYLIGKGLQ